MIINILIHPFYTEESSKFLDVYDEQLSKGEFNIILYPQVDKNLKRILLKKHYQDLKMYYNTIKNKSDLDAVYTREQVMEKYYFNIHHTAFILRQTSFRNFIRFTNKKHKNPKLRKRSRKNSSRMLKKFFNRFQVIDKVIKLSKSYTVFKDDVIFTYSTEARKYLEDKFNKKVSMTNHIDGGSFITVDSVIRAYKEALKSPIVENTKLEIKVFGEYKNLCVTGLCKILDKYEIEYEVLNHLCSFNSSKNNEEPDSDEYFYINKGEK